MKGVRREMGSRTLWRERVLNVASALCSSSAEGGGGGSLISHLLTEPHLALPGAGMSRDQIPFEWFLLNTMRTDGLLGWGWGCPQQRGLRE